MQVNPPYSDGVFRKSDNSFKNYGAFQTHNTKFRIIGTARSFTQQSLAGNT